MGVGESAQDRAGLWVHHISINDLHIYEFRTPSRRLAGARPIPNARGHCFEVEMSANRLILIINKHEHKHK